MLTLTDIQTVNLQVSILDAVGNPAVTDGAPVWASSDTAILTVAPSDDGLSAVVSTVGSLGVGQITVTADAKIGDEVKPINGVLDVTVIGSEASTIAIVADVPTDK